MTNTEEMIEWLDGLIELYGQQVSEWEDGFAPECLEKTKRQLFMQNAIRDFIRLHSWQPIETAPKNGARVLLFTEYGPSCGHFDGTWHVHSVCYTPVVPTHWMPLPPKPDKAMIEAAEVKDE